VTTNKKNLLLELKNAEHSHDLESILKSFYDETSNLVYRFARKRGLSSEVCDDIVQIVYTQIYKKRQAYNPEHNELAWLFIITRSETKDYLKAERLYKHYVTEFSDFLSQNSNDSPSTFQEAQLGGSANSGLLESDLLIQAEAAGVLTLKERQILLKRYEQDKDFDVIAQEMQTSSGNIRKIISRTLEKLRKIKVV